MIKCKSIKSSLLQVALILTTCSLAQQLVCQSNDCDRCCVTSDFCSAEHTLISEEEQCRYRNSRSSPVTPMIPGLEFCPFDLHTFQYESCPNSRVYDSTKSIGDYGKPTWVGAEFQALSYDSFSVTVMWEHIDADIQLRHLNRSSVQGYEVRIYRKESGKFDQVQQCFCVMDPSMRNISDIRTASFTYREMSHMIVEVRSFPSQIGRDESNTRRNCSLLTGCTTTEDCFMSPDCYSWPQGCLNLTFGYNPGICVPPVYGPPVNVKAEMSLIDNNNNATNGDNWQLDLYWEPPRMNYMLFPVPNVYYVTIEGAQYTFNFKIVNTTRIMLLGLTFRYTYINIYVRAYVPCSGLSNTFSARELFGCGNSYHVKYYLPTCEDPTPPLHGWFHDYHGVSLHSTVIFQCDSGWSPSEQFTTTCVRADIDQPKWVPDPANHICSGMFMHYNLYMLNADNNSTRNVYRHQ